MARHTKTTPACGDPCCEARPPLEIHAQDGHPGHEETPGTEADAQRLRQHDLPVLRAEAGGQGAEHHQRGASPDELGKKASIEGGASADADENEQKCLRGPDPRDCTWRCLREEEGFIVHLEGAVAVDDTPIVGRRVSM